MIREKVSVQVKETHYSSQERHTEEYFLDRGRDSYPNILELVDGIARKFTLKADYVLEVTGPKNTSIVSFKPNQERLRRDDERIDYILTRPLHLDELRTLAEFLIESKKKNT